MSPHSMLMSGVLIIHGVLWEEEERRRRKERAGASEGRHEAELGAFPPGPVLQGIIPNLKHEKAFDIFGANFEPI